MGNYVSCTLSNPVIGQNAAAKVILPGGEVRRIDGPTKAAELMLDAPEFFVVNTRSLRVGARFSALSADEDLEMSNVYVMFPMKRVNSVVTASDMGAMFLAATSKKSRSSPAKNSDAGVRRITRVLPAESEAPKLNLDDIDDFSAPEFMHRLSMSRSKKPLLETIAEEPLCLRS